MPRRKANKLEQLGFEVKAGHGHVPVAYKCFCGGMQSYMAYRDALNHSYRCRACKMKLCSKKVCTNEAQELQVGLYELNVCSVDC